MGNTSSGRFLSCDGVGSKDNELVIPNSEEDQEVVKVLPTTLFEKVGGQVFLDRVIDIIALNNEDLEKNVRVDLRCALLGNGPFDACNKTQVCTAIQAMAELENQVTIDVLKAIDDAAIFSLTGRRCPMSGTLQRDDNDMCPITELGLSIAKDRATLLQQVGKIKLDASVHSWMNKMSEDSELSNVFLLQGLDKERQKIAQHSADLSFPHASPEIKEKIHQSLRSFLCSILANDKKDRVLPTFEYAITSILFTRMRECLRIAMEENEIRPMLIAETCNRIQAWWEDKNMDDVGKEEETCKDEEPKRKKIVLKDAVPENLTIDQKTKPPEEKNIQEFTACSSDESFPKNKKGGIKSKVNKEGSSQRRKSQDSSKNKEKQKQETDTDTGSKTAGIPEEDDSNYQPDLFERIGGLEAMETLADQFHSDLRKHETLGPAFFKAKTEEEWRALKNHQLTFFQQLFTGVIPDIYLKEAHAKIKITEKHFQDFVSQFMASAVPLIGMKLTMEVLKLLEPYQKILATKPPKKPKPFKLFPKDFKLPTKEEGRQHKMFGQMHWSQKARDDMIKEIELKMKKAQPKNYKEGNKKIQDKKNQVIPDVGPASSAFANLTLEGAHVVMPRPKGVKLPDDFREYIGTLSIKELSTYRATSHRKLISVWGYLFDASDRPDKYAVGAPYEELTGKDITWALASGDDSPYNANKFYDMFKRPEGEGGNVIMKGKKSPDYDQLYHRIAGLCGWLHHFNLEYGESVGRLDVYEDEFSLCWPPEMEVGCSIM